MFVSDRYCCICVQQSLKLENINNGASAENITYRQKLSTCVPNQNWDEHFKICANCIEKLDFSYDFLQVCITSEKLRKEKNGYLINNKNENESLQCKICDKSFKLKRSLKSHITRFHTKNEVIKEEDTPTNISTDKDNFSQHLEVVLDLNYGNSIIERDKVNFTSRENNENLDNSEYLDEICDNSDTVNISSEEDNLEVKPDSKKRINKRKNPLTCEYCGKIFYRRQHYSAHIRAKHTFEKPYKCNLCEAKYTNSHSLLVHKRNHNNEKPFICSYCGKSFVCSGDLYHHSKIHLNKREYKCSMCSKSFNTASILRTHKICLHTSPEDWKYVCSYCSRRFPIHSSLTTHIKRHTGLREACCHICSKKFFDKSELKKHFRSHSSECHFKCNICKDKEYKTHYALRKHQKLVHDIGTIKIIKPEKKFPCTMCPKIFTFNNKLKKHMCTHTGEKPFKCYICEKGFIDNYYRKIHLKKKHNIESSENR